MNSQASSTETISIRELLQAALESHLQRMKREKGEKFDLAPEGKKMREMILELLDESKPSFIGDLGKEMGFQDYVTITVLDVHQKIADRLDVPVEEVAKVYPDDLTNKAIRHHFMKDVDFSEVWDDYLTEIVSALDMEVPHEARLALQPAGGADPSGPGL